LAVRTAFPGTSTTGITHTAANDNALPGGWIGHVTRNTDSSAVDAETDLTGVTFTVTVNTNRRIKLSWCCNFSASIAGGRAFFHIKESTTYLSTRAFPSSGTGNNAATMFVVITPSSGSHTYKIALEAPDAGTATLQAAGVGNEAHFLCEDLGPAS
jgi:hypothetical protein